MRNFWLVAPFATWIILMSVLPATVSGYAVRTAVVAAMLAAGRVLQENGRLARSSSGLTSLNGQDARSPGKWIPFVVGLTVFVLWILPEQFDWVWYRKWCIVGEGGTQAVAEASTAMIVVRLIGSAFVISVAEELFFRKWLISFAGFWWMVALFAVEHDRWLVGAIAGAIYGLLYLRRGLLAAIVAHATTNLVLGLWVLKTGQWQFW